MSQLKRSRGGENAFVFNRADKNSAALASSRAPTYTEDGEVIGLRRAGCEYDFIRVGAD
jgi:hypothetical protein